MRKIKKNLDIIGEEDLWEVNMKKRLTVILIVALALALLTAALCDGRVLSLPEAYDEAYPSRLDLIRIRDIYNAKGLGR